MDPLKEQKRHAHLIRTLIESEGWKEVLEPHLIRESELLMRQLIAAPTGTDADIKAEIRAIQRLLGKITELAKLA